MRFIAVFICIGLAFTTLGCDSGDTTGSVTEGTPMADSSGGGDDASAMTQDAVADQSEADEANGPVGDEGGCTPDCAGKTCGEDGCGGSCGACSAGQVCNGDGQCGALSECTDTCAGLGWTCGTVCGEACGVCNEGDACQDGTCSCTASCVGVECGDDGCGGTCGMCTDGTVCDAGACVDGTTTCVAECNGKECGPDGCGGTCGGCPPSEECISGQCQGAVTCTPSCAGKQCGDDGCGGSCGNCAAGQTCSPAGQCQGDGVAGGASCQDTYNCMAQCGQDQGCAGQCQSLASAQAMTELQALVGCQQSCTTQDMTCIAETCIDELAECFFDIHGTASCNDMFGCLQTCGQMDTGCQDGCINQGSLPAQATFMAINVCLSNACPTQTDACINQAAGPGGACESYVNACFVP